MKPLIVKNSVYSDSRGQFIRIFDNQSNYGTDLQLMQISVSKNPISKTLRGMHFQVAGRPEHKIITVINGEIQLVVSNAHIVHKREEVENYYFNLSEASSETLFVPSGLATGWMSLTDNATISYLMTSRFENCEYSGFCFDDPFASINWPSSPEVVSDKDRSWPLLR
jgi:dTDP-4-dehydrorhamnose 3,5-epimerase